MRKILGIVVFTCLMYSCSGIPKEKEVNVSNVEITGFIKDYVKVVDGSYKFTNNDDEAFISIKLELIDKPNTDYCTENFARIRLNAIGDNGELFDTGVYGFTASDNEFKKIAELLKSEIGEAKTISFKWDYFGLDSNKEISNAIFAKSTSFELIDNGFTTDCNDNKSSDSAISESSEN